MLDSKINFLNVSLKLNNYGMTNGCVGVLQSYFRSLTVLLCYKKKKRYRHKFLLNTLYYRINFKHLKIYFSLMFYEKMNCNMETKKK